MIKKNLTLVLKALDSLAPYCEKAGVETREIDAYDEWELLVQQVFDSFIIIPIVDVGGKFTEQQFKKLGFVNNLEKKLKVISAKYDGSTLYLHDIVSPDGKKNLLEWRLLGNDGKNNTKSMRVRSIRKFSDFEVVSLL